MEDRHGDMQDTYQLLGGVGKAIVEETLQSLAGDVDDWRCTCVALLPSSGVNSYRLQREKRRKRRNQELMIHMAYWVADR
eukprot:733039-Hanusia_phi.AAC.1